MLIQEREMKMKSLHKTVKLNGFFFSEWASKTLYSLEATGKHILNYK